MKYIINGDPVALARPRFGKNHVYDGQRHLKVVARIDLENQHDGLPLIEKECIHLSVCFYLRMPKKASKKPLENVYHVKKPDLSNLIKFIEDICTGIIYKDDSLICSIEAKKRYSSNPRTEADITIL